MHPHTHAHRRTVRERRSREGALRRGRSTDGQRSDGEDDEQRVTFHAHLDAAVLESVAEQARVCLEDILVAVGAEPVLELGRALDVGEEKREGTCRQPSPRAHPPRILPYPAFAKTRGTP